MKAFRTFTFVLLPLITLVLGWQLGATYEMRQLVSEKAKINNLFSVDSGSGKTVKTDPEKEVDISLFWSVWRLLDKYYVDPGKLEIRQMVFGAVGGMVKSLGDPYTLFFTPPDTTAFSNAMSGTLEGIGAQLNIEKGNIVVVAPLKGSPAETAGLKPKDIIVGVNDKDVTGFELDNVVTLIRGPKGTTVTLQIIRPPDFKRMNIAITRDAIRIPSVESKVIKTATGSVGLIVLNQFGGDSINEIKKAIAAMPMGELKGLIIDLRYNGGGYLEAAVQLVSMFVREGVVVSVVGRDPPPEVHAVTGSPTLPDIPLVVLVNGGSASASEITAGALQDHKRATIVGTQSFGKGTVQDVIDLPGGSSLHVTIAHWHTPSGHDLGKKGVTPDIIVDRTQEQYQAGYDPQMEAAQAWLTAKKLIFPQSASGSVK